MSVAGGVGGSGGVVDWTCGSGLYFGVRVLEHCRVGGGVGMGQERRLACSLILEGVGSWGGIGTE